MDSTLWPLFLMWCAIFNLVALGLAFAGFVVLHDWLYRLHHRWFAISVARFDAIAYVLLGVYKLAIWFLLIIPSLALTVAYYGTPC